MIIGIDITQLNYIGTGVANYTFQLVKNLLLLDKKNKYKLFYSSFRRPNNFYYLDELKKLGGKIYAYRFPPSSLNFLWGKNHLIPIDWFTGKVDVFFFSDFLRPPLAKETKGITTIHDLTWKLYPDYHTQTVIEAHEKKIEKTLKFGDEIIVDSKNTKKDLLNLYPKIKKNKVHVIYPGVDERFKKIDDTKMVEKVLKKYLAFNFEFLNFNYLLYVGAIEPRKNLDKAINIFHQLINSSKKYSQYKFLIIGKAGWKNEKIYQMVKDLNLENKVLFLGYVKDEDLPYFYSSAKATFYLSSYEGFGLPVVESAKCQTPVLLYQNSSLKEIFTNDYPYTKGGEELSTLIYLINSKINLESYLTKDFSWKETAEKFLTLIENDYKKSSD